MYSLNVFILLINNYQEHKTARTELYIFIYHHGPTNLFLPCNAMISVVTKDSRAVILECFLHTAFLIIHWCALLCQYILSWSCDSVCLPPLHGHRRVSSAPSLAWFATIASASTFGCPQFLDTPSATADIPATELSSDFPLTSK